MVDLQWFIMLFQHQKQEQYPIGKNTYFLLLIAAKTMIVRLSLLRKTILIPEYLAFMCVCVFVDGCISQDKQRQY